MCDQYNLEEIAPFDDAVFSEKMESLIREPGFEYAVKYAMPGIDYPEFCKMLKFIPDKETFQRKVMQPFLESLEKKTTNGITSSGIENLQNGVAYTFMSNHRDIVLDASFLNLSFVRAGRRTSEVAIGSNLLIFDWITDLVKLNKSFIVKRNIQRTKALEAAYQLSAYIHFAINKKKESVWIAQREGRAKDSNDITQESLIKMLALEGGETVVENIKSINIVPVSISYEFDPNDYLKAKEFLMKRLNPEFKKSQDDDLLSMQTGLLNPKGRVHFHVGKCINNCFDNISENISRAEAVKIACQAIDKQIHLGYNIYPINYIAYDKVLKTDRFSNEYSSEQVKEIETYIESQLAKVNMPDIAADDINYMREMMYTMYANPLINKIQAVEGDK